MLVGLFTPKISKFQLLQAENDVRIMNDCVKLVNTTNNPEVFFSRLNMLLDVLLHLQKYEKYRILKGTPPSVQYRNTLAQIEETVDSFVCRAYYHEFEKAKSLKTEKARSNRMRKFALNLANSFRDANTFWSGWPPDEFEYFPHYTGPLFTPQNASRANALIAQIWNS